MEAVPRLPMVSFDLKTSPEPAQFGPQLKQYIANFYNEDPESYNTEISNLEALRSAAVRPTIDVAGCQLLKKYYCQLHFLKSRFPMQELQAAAVYFSWKDSYSNMPCSVPDIRFELMCILYNIGALHTQLGASNSRTSPDGLKMACTHFQCAAWAFQTVKENYYQMIPYISSVEVVHFMQQMCYAQAQECILEKSMMDNRKATITAKVAVQVVDYYRRSLTLLTNSEDDNGIMSSRTAKEWMKYLSFKVSYHKCIALLFQGQQAEEQQKMGERVAFYQAACEQLEEARKLATGLKQQQKEVAEAIAFTSDVVEGKRKAAKNENEFIYHEEVPDKHALQEVKGAALVKGIAFNVNDVEVSGPDIFARLVPMEAHEASSLYSEKKAQMLRQIGELVESKDQALAEFMSSLQLEIFTQMRQASGLSQELIDRAAALSVKPNATQDLVQAMGKLSNSYHEVEAMLNEIQELLKEEEQNEKEYQELMGKRPPSIIATDLSREAAKYREAHNKANDSNQNLHKAMTTHVANLKILAQPLSELQQQIPSVDLNNSNIDNGSIKEIESLIAKVEEMRNQRAMLWTQFRETVHKDDITNVLVTRQPDQPLDQLFQQELQKHQELASLIEQNAAAQENILKAFVDAYARSTPTRRYLHDIINKRNSTVNALITSFDTREDLLAKANKGIDFYNKLETNVLKLLQRIKSASKVQQEEREQMLAKNAPAPTQSANITEDIPQTVSSTTPKLKDYLDSRKKVRNHPENSQYYQPPSVGEPQWPPAVRPTPVGSEVNNDQMLMNAKNMVDNEQILAERMANVRLNQYYPQAQPVDYSGANKTAFTATTDMYQPISSLTTGNEPYSNYGQANQPSYYPEAPPNQNYSYNYAEYATSVHLNISNTISSSSTYSSPSANMSGSYVISNGQSYQGQQYPNTAYYYPQNYPTYSYGYTTPSQPQAALSNANTSYGYGAQSPSISNVSLSSTQPQVSAPTTNTVYSYGYVAPSEPQMSASISNTSLPNATFNYGYVAPAATASNISLPTTSYSYGYVAPAEPQNSNTSLQSYGYVAPTEHQIAVPPSNTSLPAPTYSYGCVAPAQPVTTKESNIDLLTGLDFTVNQAPLIPQQPVPEVIQLEQNKAKPSIIKEESPPNPPPKIENIIHRKPLNTTTVKQLFQLEVDKFEKFVSDLPCKTLSGPTNLDLKWKEILDKQEMDKKAISVARCYPMKNRYPDILPYDYSRVELKDSKDDYINASHIRDISYYGAPMIVTQAPLASTVSDFWMMIREQHVELIVCLLGEGEMGPGEVYWPLEKGRDLSLAGMVISLMSVTVKSCWTERLIQISIPEKRDSRVILHLQFAAWPGSLLPTNPEAFIGFVTEIVGLFLQQRSTLHPIVIHCSSGIGRSGVVALLVSVILEVTNNAVSLPDLVAFAVKLTLARRNILRDREHLKFAYDAFLAYMKQVIVQGQAKKMLKEVVNSKEEVKIESNKPEVVDPLSSLDPFWASKKN